MESKPIETALEKPGMLKPGILFLLLIQFVLVYWQVTSPLFWQTTSLNTSAFTACESAIAAAYCFKLPSEWATFPAQYLKTVKVTENGVNLPFQESLDAISSKQNLGWFAIVKDNLVVTPSKNSDPGNNKKAYQIVQPVPLPLFALGISGICAAAAVWYFRTLLQSKHLLIFGWLFLFFVSAKSLFPGLLWWVVAFANLALIYFLQKRAGSKILTRRQMFASLVIYGIFLVGFLELR